MIRWRVRVALAVVARPVSKHDDSLLMDAMRITVANVMGGWSTPHRGPDPVEESCALTGTRGDSPNAERLPAIGIRAVLPGILCTA